MPQDYADGYKLDNLRRASQEGQGQAEERPAAAASTMSPPTSTSMSPTQNIDGARHRCDTDETQPLTAGSQHAHHDHNNVQNQRLNRRTVRKLDFILLPFLALLFLLNSLDKSNIGNAETAGFTYDTGLSRQDVNTSMSVFFFVFVLLQPVGAALGRRFGMRRYVPACMSLWGLSTILHIFVRKQWHLIVLRIAIATLESGFYPTTVSYLSLFYTKYEFAVRLGLFYGMSAVSGVVGGVLSWAIFSEFPGHGDDVNGPNITPSARNVLADRAWKSWEVLFLIEGCITMTVALLGFLWLPASADRAWFLTADERSWAEKRMRQDTFQSVESSHYDIDMDMDEDEDEADFEDATVHRQEVNGTQNEGRGEADYDRLLGSDNNNSRLTRLRSAASAISITADSGLSRQDVLSAVFNYKIWLLLICNILSAIPAVAFGVLLPILVKELSPSLNLTPAASNLLSAPPFAFGAVVLFIFVVWSDRSRRRLLPILSALVLLLLGLVITVLAPMGNYWLRYFSLCVLLSGSFIASPLTIAWLANNTPEPGKRAILLGINGWGNLAGVFMAVLFTPEDREAGYVRPFTILLVCVLASFAGFIAFRFLVISENGWRDNVLRSWSNEEKEQEKLLGDIPAPDHFGQRLARRTGLLTIAKMLGLEENRRGDEKLTFRYTM